MKTSTLILLGCVAGGVYYVTQVLPGKLQASLAKNAAEEAEYIRGLYGAGGIEMARKYAAELGYTAADVDRILSTVP